MKVFRGVFFALVIEGLALALVLSVCTVARAEVIWWNEAPLPYGTPVVFVDSVVGTVHPAHRADWRRERNEALDAWGVPYTVVRVDGLPAFDMAVTEERNGLPGVIRIGRDESGACQNYGGWYGTVGGGVAVVCLPARWWAVWDISVSLAHEVGHAFGLGHSTTGVMGGGLKVSEEERAAVNALY